jgi:hypothetical protein
MSGSGELDPGCTRARRRRSWRRDCAIALAGRPNILLTGAVLAETPPENLVL